MVGLGANLGDRAATLERVIDGMRGGAIPDTDVIAVSSTIETRPLGPPQPDFLNAAIALDTDLDARALLDQLLALETGLGRVRDDRWGPRIIDLDLLAWVPAGASSSAQVSEVGLEVPHPEAHRRDFVLVPLSELWPELRIHDRSVAEHLAALDPGASTLPRP
ncbi:MAG: 2-amino-4-hydroxy-6-hydroxymethyldihydropteridine diphosphokinase [Deltaproteobacteria bacterium]|nr:2-amino-4-hydroxy-6-hydroxymethyldihydropteridine diphosphokinase [Nannocystaceae bacterium]